MPQSEFNYDLNVGLARTICESVMKEIQVRLSYLRELFGDKFVRHHFGFTVVGDSIGFNDGTINWAFEETWSHGGYELHYCEFPIILLTDQNAFESFINEYTEKVKEKKQSFVGEGI